MIAPAEAVMPIIRLLVAVATRSGTPITMFMTGTLTMPAADAEQGRHDAGADTARGPERDVADAIGRARQVRVEELVVAGLLDERLLLRPAVRVTEARPRRAIVMLV